MMAPWIPYPVSLWLKLCFAMYLVFSFRNSVVQFILLHKHQFWSSVPSSTSFHSTKPWCLTFWLPSFSETVSWLIQFFLLLFPLERNLSTWSTVYLQTCKGTWWGKEILERRYEYYGSIIRQSESRMTERLHCKVCLMHGSSEINSFHVCKTYAPKLPARCVIRIESKNVPPCDVKSTL